jgi:tetratricopeptide (TPR) repeat protein
VATNPRGPEEKMKAFLFFAGMSVFVLTAAQLQKAERTEFTVRGEISSLRPLIGGYTIELTPSSGLKESVPLGADGSFEFRSGQSGPLDLRVVEPGGKTIHQETVFVNGPYQMLAIRLPEEPSVPKPAANTVSIQELQHKIPPQAQKAFDRGLQAAAEGKNLDAVEAFRQAVTLDPEYANALNELGAAEAALGDMTSAAEAFQKAVDVAPEHAFALPNLSIVLAKLGRFHEAAQVARRALKVVPNSGKIQYILAVSILIDHGSDEEALDHLERAASEVPRAHLVAADVLILKGQQEQAVRHLEEFLRIAPADDKERANAEARLAGLRH